MSVTWTFQKYVCPRGTSPEKLTSALTPESAWVATGVWLDLKTTVSVGDVGRFAAREVDAVGARVGQHACRSSARRCSTPARTASRRIEPQTGGRAVAGQRDPGVRTCAVGASGTPRRRRSRARSTWPGPPPSPGSGGYSRIALPGFVQFTCSTAEVTTAPAGTRPAPLPIERRELHQAVRVRRQAVHIDRGAAPVGRRRRVRGDLRILYLRRAR